MAVWPNRSSDVINIKLYVAWQAQGFRVLGCRYLKPTTQNPWKGCKFHVTEILLNRDYFAW